jgi:hypothetical protein
VLIERISLIRTTHYGDFWSFNSWLDKLDTSYTDLSLDPRTDSTYFTDPGSGISLGCTGGKVLIFLNFKVDGFATTGARCRIEEYETVDAYANPDYKRVNWSIEGYTPF